MANVTPLPFNISIVIGSGPFLNSGTIANGSTIVQSAIPALGLIGNASTAAAAGGGVALGTGLSLTAGSTAYPGGTLQVSGGVLGPGLFTTPGTLGGTFGPGSTAYAIAQATITVSGTHTILSPDGYSSLLVNLNNQPTTLDIAAGYTKQRIEVDLKQGTTAVVVTLGTSVALGSIPNFIASAVAADIDELLFTCSPGNNARWRLEAVNQGFTI